DVVRGITFQPVSLCGRISFEEMQDLRITNADVIQEIDKQTGGAISIERIFICGLALDYCCYFTAMDGIDFGFKVYFIVDLTKGIDIPEGNISQTLSNMKVKGIKFANLNSFV
ncbi:unnamed protein product, partial [marine sediment metagenome]